MANIELKQLKGIGPSIVEKLNSIKNDIIIVAENGGIIVDNTKVLASKSIANSKIKSIDNIIDTIEDIITIYCTKDLAYIKDTSPENITIVKEYYSNYRLIKSISEIKDNVVIINYAKKNKLETSEIFWDQKTHYFFTEKRFVFYTLTDTIYGTGFEASEDLDVWWVKNQSGVIEIKE